MDADFIGKLTSLAGGLNDCTRTKKFEYESTSFFPCDPKPVNCVT